MAHFEFYELSQGAKGKVAHLRWHIAANRVLLAGYRLAALLEKANFNPNQPRVSRGTSGGGRWAGGDASSTNGDNSRVWLSPAKPDIRPRPIADTTKPPIGEPPDIPVRPPDSGRARNTLIRGAVRWLSRARSGTAVGRSVWAAIEAASWAEPYVTSYFDSPKSLEDMQRAVSDPKTGYDVHHVVERTSALNAGFPISAVDGPENLVRIPTLKHWEINSWFETVNDIYGGLTPREYLRNPKIGWDERVKSRSHRTGQVWGHEAVKRDKLADMTVNQLVQRFVEIGVAQDNALLMGETANFNRLYDQKADVLAQLKKRDGDQRHTLLQLYDHSNMQVRLNAVKATLAVAPQLARQALEAIARSQYFPQAGDAGMSIFNLDNGVFKPT